MRDLLLVGAGGFVGAILRYAIGLALIPRMPTTFPVHTFLINVTGSLALGMIARGYRTIIQGVVMVRGDHAGLGRPDRHVLADWR